MRVGKTLIPFTATILAACTSVPGEGEIAEGGVSPGQICDAGDLQRLIGEQANENTGEIARKHSGAKTLRWIPPNSAVTMDYRQDRLNISYDENMAITKVSCG